MHDAAHLKRSRRLVAEAEARVLAQRDRVVRLTTAGQNQTLAEDLLFAFEESLFEMQICLQSEERWFPHSSISSGRGRDDALYASVKPRLGLIRIVRKLYAAQINVVVGSDGHGGFRVGISKDRHRLGATEHFATAKLDRIAEWLDCKARELYPREVA